MTSKTKIDLIVRVLTKTASKPEEEQFETWLQESEENQVLYRQIKILWERVSNTYDSLELNEAAAKAKIISKILRRESKARVLRARFWISAAASLLILLGIGYFAYTKSNGYNTNIIHYSTTDNSIREVVLPDGSHIWLNENSTLRLAKTYAKNQRKVFLDGEAYFEVARDQSLPFKVITGNTVTKVLGTSFNLSLDSKSNVRLNVKSGKVQFFQKNSLKTRLIFLKGDQGEFLAAENKLSHSVNENENYLSWKTGVLTFNNAPLNEVCLELSKYYDTPVKTSINDSKISLTGKFQNEELADIITTIKLTLDIESSKTGDGILLYK